MSILQEVAEEDRGMLIMLLGGFCLIGNALLCLTIYKSVELYRRAEPKQLEYLEQTVTQNHNNILDLYETIHKLKNPQETNSGE